MFDMIMWSSSDNSKVTSVSMRGIHGPCVGKLVSIFSKLPKLLQVKLERFSLTQLLLLYN
jgi:hypothetical protein